MQPERIVIFHAAAIGDAVLATPAAANLKRNYPSARITYVTHPSLVPLLLLCRGIDDFQTYDREDGTMTVRSKIAALKPDLVVDLSGSSKSFLQTALLAKKVLHYRKQKQSPDDPIHAADNFLATLAPLNLAPPAAVFPTLVPEAGTMDQVRKSLPEGKAVIGLVPGVGSARPSRAWPEDQWMALARRLLRSSKYTVVLVGGQDEKALCQRIVEFSGANCLNMAGRLGLPETAALLKCCAAVVSGDTGPAHIAVAVGTPVVGLYGPTLVARSGAYGMNRFAVNAGHHCRCQTMKHCTISGEGRPGDCMTNIQPEEVLAKLTDALASLDSPGG